MVRVSVYYATLRKQDQIYTPPARPLGVNLRAMTHQIYMSDEISRVGQVDDTILDSITAAVLVVGRNFTSHPGPGKQAASSTSVSGLLSAVIGGQFV